MCTQVSDTKYEWKKSPGRPRCRWEYSIKIGLEEMRLELESCDSGQQLQMGCCNTVANLYVPNKVASILLADGQTSFQGRNLINRATYC
jgi:hypothetical protein